MALKCGIVGLPNVGKSTLFNSLTKAGIAAQNYPFCTIEPNTGTVTVPDTRLTQLAEIVDPEQVLATTFEFVDIAGLVAGAHEGEGLGNKFLAHIRETDAIAHVVRCFEDDDITHVAGRIDPLDDIQVIETELLLADLETVEKHLQRQQKLAKSGDKEIQAKVAVLTRVKEHLDRGLPVRTFEDASECAYLHLLTMKPMMYLANVAEDGFTNNSLLESVVTFARKVDAVVVPFCAQLEAELAELSDEEKAAFLKDYGLAEPGLHRVIRAGYELLDLETYFTAGKKEVRAWTIRRGSTAPQAAGKIHTDFEKGFIRAEVIGFADYIQYRGESGAKEAGKWRLEGKEYIVTEGDVMHFRFNTSS